MFFVPMLLFYVSLWAVTSQDLCMLYGFVFYMYVQMVADVKMVVVGFANVK